MKHVTMKDIAEKAGVTKATVSMVINNDRRITQITREKVLKIVQDMNYYPNESAQKLAKGKTGIIAFLTPRFGSPFIFSIMDAFENRTYEAKQFASGIQPYTTWNQISVLEDLLRKILYGRKADAVILLSQIPGKTIVEEYQENGIPLVLIENDLPYTNSICVDNFKGGFLATDYLLKNGHKNIGFITGVIQPSDPGLSYNVTMGNRLKGHQKALKNHGIPFDPEKTAIVPTYNFEEGKKAVDELFKMNNNLDSVFCAAGDLVAMGAMEQLKERGKRIPEDVAVVGYDDILTAQLVQPSLTTVRQNFEEIAHLAFEMAMNDIDSKLKNERHVVLNPQLILRDSA